MRALLVAFVFLAVPACGGDDDDDDDATGQDAGVDASDDVDAAVVGTLEILKPGDSTPLTRQLLGEIFELHATGLPPNAGVTLHTSMTGYRSEVVFLTDASGAFDTGSFPAASGSYSGIDREGVVWSMSRVDGEEPDGDIDLTFEVLFDGDLVASTTLERYRLEDGAQTIAVDDDAIVGTFYVPAGEGPFPAVIVFGGSEGGRSTGEATAQHLASKGIAALGLAYFAAEGVPDDLSEIPLEYFGHALDWLAARPEIDPDHLGAMGGSRGGELALLLGATFPQLHAIVAYVPSGVVWPGFSDDVAGPAWTLAGVPFPEIPIRAAAATEPGPNDETVYLSRRMFEESVAVATPEELEAATIRVENTAGPILMLAGEDDQLWPSCPLAEISRARLEATGHLATWGDELVCYEHAGHGLLRIGLPTTQTIIRHPVNGSLYELGGTAAGNALAGRNASARVDAFFTDNLAL